MGEREELRKKVLLDLLSHPLTLLPVAGGVTALLASWVGLGGKGLLFGGILGILGGVGTFFTRLFMDAERLVQKALDEKAAEALNARELELDKLKLRLLNDKDARTQRLLSDLRELEASVAKNELLGTMNAASATEVRSQVKRLVAACVRSLERTAELWQQAEKTFNKEAKQALLDEREREIEEVTAALGSLSRLVKERVSEAAQDEDSPQQEASLTELRSELARSLEVAKRVDERMRALDDELVSGSYDSALENDS